MMRRYTYNNIVKAARLLSLVVLMAFGAGLKGWGQSKPNGPDDEYVKGILNNYGVLNQLVYDSYVDEKSTYEGGQWVIDRVWYLESNNIFWPDNVSPSEEEQKGLSIVNDNSVIEGNAETIIYAKPGDTKTFSLQEGSGADNLDGFIRWYVTKNLENDNQQTIENLNWSGDVSKGRVRGKALKFDNGLAWLRGKKGLSFKLCLKYTYNGWNQGWGVDGNWSGYQNSDIDEDDTSPSSVSNIQYTVPDNVLPGDVIYVVCEASARNNASGSGNIVTAPKISKKSVFEIHILSSDGHRFEGKTTTILDSSSNLLSDAISNPSNYFIENYEIHTPIATGTNYRLAEPLGNYYIPSQSGNYCWVQWRMFNSEGIPVTGTYTNSDNQFSETNVVTEVNKNIIKYKFPYTSTEEQYIYYLTASVGYSNSEDRTPTSWYPVSLLKVYLDPFVEPLTEEALKSKENNEGYLSSYRYRFDSYLKENGYEVIHSISFEESDADTIAVTNVDPENNVRLESIANMRSSYAFIDAGIGSDNGFQWRRNDRLSAGRGEFGLYRTLNFPDKSKGSFSINGKTGIYNDWFASHGYDKRVVDRLWEKTNGEQSGYFMYLDATDEPGIITKIDISNLCPHTTLLVSAWICDLAESTGVEHADVGFTLKRIIGGGDSENEEILVKYYSGIVTNIPAHGTTGDENNTAKWQQVFFRFTFNEATYNDRYVLEISNNAPRSAGADYAIDDIMVYKSTPNISVQRENACEASTLQVGSDYETLLRNMGWDLNPNVLEDVDLKDPAVRKFRYGLMGTTADWFEGDLSKVSDNSKKLGNVYFGFVEDPTVAGDEPEHWVTVNKRAMENTDGTKYALYKSIRVAVPTDETFETTYIPHTQSEALRREYILNVRAMNDFVKDKDSWMGENISGDLSNALKTLWLNDDVNIDAIEKNVDGAKDLYEQSVIKLFNYLGIPRIRCPWIDSDKITLHLNAIDVGNTDLRFKGEIYDGALKPADGIYWVVIFSATDVLNASEDNPAVVVNDDCTLKSEFYVVPSVTITVDTKTETGGMTCIGSIHTLSADLMVADVDTFGNVVSADMVPFDDKYPDGSYTFDWFLGSESDYQKQTVDGKDLQSIISELRGKLKNRTENFDAEDVDNSDLLPEEKALLKKLLGDETHEPLLVTGKSVSFRWVEKVVAIPYVPNIESDKVIKLFCTKPQEITLDSESNVPELSFGFSGVDYPDDETIPEDVKLFNAPLRLGLRHIKDGSSLSNIPIRDEIVFGVEGDNHSLQKLPEDRRHSILLRNSPSVYTEVAELSSLYVDKNKTNDSEKPNVLSFEFKEQQNGVVLADLFKEGETYSLYVPFGEYDESDNFIQNSCEGYAVLEIKIVPEYLTWSGKGSTWYNDENAWTISTSEELYGKVTNTVSIPSFSPLYFTKITIPQCDENANELGLKDESSYENKTLDFQAMEVTSGVTSNIQYDMAVGSDAGSNIRPYYGNWVDQIYFKPEATLMNQHYLDYQKAWVDFEMEAGKPYWMSAPLKGVYAGDMYAPSSNGRQETEAFTDITYSGKNENGTTNSRWNPAFYQKAWDKAITYSNNEDGTSTTSINAVKFNWSIEYNDVTVPYSLGKGFYSLVEYEKNGTTGNVLVRLPKADTEYKYETKTRALTNTGKLPGDYGRLADGLDISIDLSKEDTETTQEEVDGDGTHFLVGNPYMTYLDMSEFFKENAKEGNSVLVKKYWLLENGASKAIVGTPDVEWGNNETEKDQISGFIPPMTAFFVELNKDATTKTIKFTTAMMAAKPTTTDNVYTKSYSASNPILTLTAERGETRSVARLLTSDKGHDAYEASEDAVILLDSELDAPMVYTVAGDVAAQFNTMQSIKNVPLGVYADKGEEVELTIRGISQFAEKLYLYDAVTKQSTPLDDDSYTFRVTGPSHGRFTLTSQNRISAESDICVYSPTPGQLLVMSAPEEPLQRVQVYDMSGRMVTSRDNIRNTTCQLTVPSGIYVVYAENETGNVRVKVRVR